MVMMALAKKCWNAAPGVRFQLPDLDKVSDWFSFNKLSLNTFRDHIEHVTKNWINSVVWYTKSEICIPLNAFLTSIACLLNQSSHMVCLSMALPQKRIWKKNESAQSRILRTIICKNECEIIEQLFEKNNILTVFELYVMEVYREIFKQLKSESPICSQDGFGLFQYNTRSKEKGLLPLTFCRTVTRAKSVDNRLRRIIDWKTWFNTSWLTENEHSSNTVISDENIKLV